MRQTLLTLALFSSVVTAQDRSDLRIMPSQPVDGQTITLQYRPTASFRPDRGDSVVAEVLAAGPSPRVYDVTLRPNAGAFRGAWTIPTGTIALCFRVAVGERVDDREHDCWTSPIYGSNGEPVSGAIDALAATGTAAGLYGYRSSVGEPTAPIMAPAPPVETPRSATWRDAMSLRDPAERWQALSAYLQQYPDMPDESTAQVLIRSAVAARAWDEADELIHRMPRKEPMWLIALAEGLLASHTTIDRASVLAKESVNAARNWNPALKPPLLSMREYRNQRAFELPLALRVYGQSLVRLGFPAIAEKVYAEAFDLLGARDADVNAAYVAVLKDLGHDDKLNHAQQRIAAAAHSTGMSTP